jgi:predicted DNA-binding protein (UPF0251 family)
LVYGQRRRRRGSRNNVPVVGRELYHQNLSEKNVREFLLEAGKVLGVLLAGVGLLYAERFRAWITEWWKSRHLHPIARAVRRSRAIHELLVEARVKLTADRVYAVQFHNGQIFTNQNCVYRMSLTQETVLSGITHLQDKLQDMMVEGVWEAIDPLFGGDTDGIERTWGSDGDPRATHYMRVEELPEGFYKSFCLANGTWAAQTSPLLDAKQCVIGYVCAEYCGQAYRDGTKKPEQDELLTHLAANVWFQLAKAKKD